MNINNEHTNHIISFHLILFEYSNFPQISHINANKIDKTYQTVFIDESTCNMWHTVHTYTTSFEVNILLNVMLS